MKDILKLKKDLAVHFQTDNYLIAGFHIFHYLLIYLLLK